MGANRVIYEVLIGGEIGSTQSADRFQYLREQRRHPRRHKRHVRAENLTIPAIIVVCDEKKP